MNKTGKRLLTCIMAFALCFHFIWVTVYCFPQSGKSNKLAILSQVYVYPIFQQNWGLFVPAPDVERQLFVRYQVGSEFTEWKDILAEEIATHKRNRLLGNEAMVLLLSNSLIYELNSLDGALSRVYTTAQNNKEFKVLQFETERYLKLKYNLVGNVGYELLLVSSKKQDGKAYYMKFLSGKF